MSISPARASTRSRPKPVVVRLEGSNQQLANLCGPLDANIKQIATALDLDISRRAGKITMLGAHAEAASKMLFAFHDLAGQRELSIEDIQLGLVELGVGRQTDAPNSNFDANAFPPLDDTSD